MRCPFGQSLKTCQQFAATLDVEECLEWPFTRDKNGYGMAWDQKKGRKASNLVCELAHGPAPADKPHAAHSCGNSSCCNPCHLRWASARENISEDRGAQGRTARGERVKRATLTEARVKEIWSLWIEGATPPGRLAEHFGVSTSIVQGLIQGRTWNHVTGLPRVRAGFIPATRPPKLTETDVAAIRQRFDNGEPIADLARAYSAWETTIGKICRRQTWKHLP